MGRCNWSFNHQADSPLYHPLAGLSGGDRPSDEEPLSTTVAVEILPLAPVVEQEIRQLRRQAKLVFELGVLVLSYADRD